MILGRLKLNTARFNQGYASYSDVGVQPYDYTYVTDWGIISELALRGYGYTTTVVSDSVYATLLILGRAALFDFPDVYDESLTDVGQIIFESELN